MNLFMVLRQYWYYYTCYISFSFAKILAILNLTWDIHNNLCQEEEEEEAEEDHTWEWKKGKKEREKGEQMMAGYSFASLPTEERISRQVGSIEKWAERISKGDIEISNRLNMKKREWKTYTYPPT